MRTYLTAGAFCFTWSNPIAVYRIVPTHRQEKVSAIVAAPQNPGRASFLSCALQFSAGVSRVNEGAGDLYTIPVVASAITMLSLMLSKRKYSCAAGNRFRLFAQMQTFP